ncbi:hypothetical protein AGOR_G00113330 [Albula goreensis]|uniref:Uncharacterized protein n=1 Tax=Albula goreensis TaxID=1534307 RepID=A0A8T3DIM5_9TELE|nr:hypothetical protein AGOR_G00113330 [Albula goreensis]
MKLQMCSWEEHRILDGTAEVICVTEVPNANFPYTRMMLPRLQRALRPTYFFRAGQMFGRVRERSPPTVRKPVSMLLVQSCDLGTHPHKEPMEPLNSPRGARDFIYSLHPTERTCLLRELHRFESIAIAQEQLEMAPPTTAQLRYVLLHNAIPVHVIIITGLSQCRYYHSDLIIQCQTMPS